MNIHLHADATMTLKTRQYIHASQPVRHAAS